MCGCPLTVWEPKQKNVCRAKAMESKDSLTNIVCCLASESTHGHCHPAYQGKTKPAFLWGKSKKPFSVTSAVTEESLRLEARPPHQHLQPSAKPSPSLPPTSCQVLGKASWSPSREFPWWCGKVEGPCYQDTVPSAELLRTYTHTHVFSKALLTLSATDRPRRMQTSLSLSPIAS